MTIIVMAPDGAEVHFPDNTPSETITSVMRAQFGGPAPANAASQPQPAKPDDPITAQVRKEYEEDVAKGRTFGSPLQRQLLQGITFNAADEILAGFATPVEMFKRGTFNPAEGYRYAKARQDLELENARKNTGWSGTVAELVGGVGSGAGLANAGLTAMRLAGPGAGLAARTGATAADAAAFGSLSGAMEGNSLAERGTNALTGGAFGAGLGAAFPLAGATISTVAAPIVSNIRARMNPQGYATRQMARAVDESGQTLQQLQDEIAAAAREGQGVYTLADALGNPGQRMLSTVARAPGPGRTAVVEALEQRQAGQGRRVAGQLAEGFDAPQTAAQTRTGIERARDAASDVAYSAARNNAGPVDLSRAVAAIDRTLQPGVNQIARPQSGLADDTVEAALSRFRARMTDGRSMLTDYTAVERVRGDLSDAVQAAVRAGAGNRARLLGQALREVDAAMEAASPGFRAANAQHRAGSLAAEAVEQGQTAANRGRSEDVIRTFQGMTPEQQAGFRAGYVDPLITQTQGAAHGVNKARQFTSDAFQSEARAIGPPSPHVPANATGTITINGETRFLINGQPGPLVPPPLTDRMLRQLGRENTMFETRNQALGGSRTADNLADAAAAGIDPGIVANLLTGNITGAARMALTAGSNVITGNTAAVREQLARMLLARGDVRTTRQAIEEATRRVERTQRTMGLLSRGALGGAAIAVQRQN